MNPSFPSRPNLEQLRKQAKDLLKLHRQGSKDCCVVLRQLRQFAKASEDEILRSDLALNEAQFALAMHYGYESWRELKQHVASLQADDAAPTLESQGDRKWIAGLEHVDWGGSFFRRQDSFMTALAAVLRATGKRVTYEELMGISGAAFKLLLELPEWCPRASSSGIAFDCTDLALRSAGYSIEWIGQDEQENPGGKEQARRAVVTSIDAGRPALYMDGEFSLIAGYRDRGRVFLCRPYDGREPGYTEMPEPRGMFGPAWAVGIVQPNRPVPDRRETLLASLRTAVQLARTESFHVRAETFASGFAGYEAWIDGLRNHEGEPSGQMLHANAYGYAILLTSRAAAAEYLRSIQRELGPAVGEHLRPAADRYEHVHRRLLAGRDCVAHPWEESWTPQNRRIESDLMSQSLADERVAISQIEQALAAIG